MLLPNYFLAHLPPEATLTPGECSRRPAEPSQTKPNTLSGRLFNPGLIRILVRWPGDWLAPADPFRELALENGPARDRIFESHARRGPGCAFQTTDPANFDALLEQDLGHRDRLEAMSGADAERRGNRSALATAPELLVHVAGGPSQVRS